MPVHLYPSDDNVHRYPIDIAHPAEWVRLSIQDDLLTEAMGGELPEHIPLEQLHTILDLACGSGGWALRTAAKYPTLQVTGVDISRHMVENANAATAAMGIAKRVHFAVADITHPLPFPDATFDFVNARFISTFFQRARWMTLLAETKRLLRTGGMVRLIEPEIGFTTGPALEKLNAAMIRAFVEQGCGISPEGRSMGVVTILPSLLREADFLEVQSDAHALEYSYGTPGHDAIYHNMEVGYLLMKPYFVAHGQLTEEEFDRLYQQALVEMQQETFRGIWLFLSTWGKKGEE